MYYDRYSPPPASSSPPAYVDSSPPASPSQQRFTSHLPIERDSSPVQNTDPLAGSQKAYYVTPTDSEFDFEQLSSSSNGKNGLKRDYMALQGDAEKPFNEPARKHGRYNSQPSNLLNDEAFSLHASQPPSTTFRHDCDAIWHETIDQAIEESQSEIDLSRRGLTHIPSGIHDLNKIIFLGPKSEYTYASTHILTATSASLTAAAPAKRSLQRFRTAPAQPGRQFGRVASLSTLGEENQFAILLRHNTISTLPKELFSLKRLTVLSLQNNLLEHIPPQIGLLTNLRELNLSTNRLKYLPAELDGLKLRSLALSGNPCLKDLAVRGSHKATPTKARPFPTSETITRSSNIPSLAELCLRVLFSRPPNALTTQTNFERQHALPLPVGSRGWAISEHIAEDLEACFYDYDGSHPDRRCISETVSSEPSRKRIQRPRPAGINHCTSPKHQGASSVYFRHQEEYMEWRTEIATVSFGGCAPLLWLGCSAGCLDHLVKDTREGGAWETPQRVSARSNDESMGEETPSAPIFVAWNDSSERAQSLADVFSDEE